MVPITKIYIDTRYKTSDSTSSSDFKVELPETITLPRGTKAYITDVSVPNTMTTITEGFSDTIYFASVFQNTMSPYNKTYVPRRATLQPGSHTAETLAATL